MKGPAKGCYHRRMDSIRQLMKARGADAAIAVVREGYNRETCFHLCGFSGSSGALLIFEDEALLVTDKRYLLQASEETDLRIVDHGVKPLMEVAAREAAGRPGVKTLGFQFQRLACDLFEVLKGTGKDFVDLSVEFSLVRRGKDPFEAEEIAKAACFAAGAFMDALVFFGPGMDEKMFAARLEYEMRTRGADGGWGAQEFIVASAGRSALPHGVPSDRKVCQGEHVLVDFGSRSKGYLCDITRAFSVGDPPAWILEAHSLLLEAQAAAIPLLEPGRAAAEIDAAARGVIEKAGFGELFIHSLGHGIGLEMHEPPTLSPRSGDTLAIGDVVTVEPGIYFPGKGGLRLEDDFYISPGGTVCLTSCLERKIFSSGALA